MDKTVASPAEAVADIPDGASVAIAGFGIGHRFPTSLIVALRDAGVRNLTVVCNSLGSVDQMRAQILAEAGQIRRLVAAFSARPGMKSPAEEQIAAGEMEIELVPQGVLVDRMRAAAAGIPAFFSPVGAETALAEGKEVREFDGQLHVLETAIHVDYAFLRAYRADRLGNCQFRGGSQNFNPAFAKAAKVAIVEADEIVEPGDIPPELVDLPGIFVDRVTRATVFPSGRPHSLRTREQSLTDTTWMKYNGKPGLSRAQVAERAARLLPDNSYVNLGLGLPTLVSAFTEGRNIVLHAENGILGYGAPAEGDGVDLDVYNAGGETVTLEPGASFFDSVVSFEIARSGRLDAVLLGAYQVDASGALANWSTPSMTGGAIGGAMDLCVWPNNVIVLMSHCDSKGRPKLVDECTFPITAPNCVSTVITDLALLERGEEGFTINEVAPGFTPEEVVALTGMKVAVADNVRTMTFAESHSEGLST